MSPRLRVFLKIIVVCLGLYSIGLTLNGIVMAEGRSAGVGIILLVIAICAWIALKDQ